MKKHSFPIIPSALGFLILIPWAAGCSVDDQGHFSKMTADNPAASSSRALFACYPREGFEVCVPSIGKGKRLLIRGLPDPSSAPVSAATEKKMLEDALAQRLELKSKVPSLAEVTNPQGEAEEALVKSGGDQRLYDATAYLPAFSQSTFSSFVNYSGPNCYYTALATKGLVDGSKPRHVGLNEFELYLKGYFDKVATPKPGDLVVYNEEGSRDHVAYYWLDDLIFHKKGFKKGYSYRIAEMDLAYSAEPFEWRSPDNSPTPILPGRRVKQRKEFFRLRGPMASVAPNDQEKAIIATIDDFVENIMEPIRERNLADTLGTMTESMANDLKRLFRPLESSKSLEGQLAFARLNSLRDQIFAAIDETLYTSPYAEPHRINERFCYHDNQATREVLSSLYFYFHKRHPSDDDLNGIFKNKLGTLSKKDCRIRVDDLVGS